MLHLECLLGGCLGSYPDHGGCTSVGDVWLVGADFIALEVLIGMLSC